MCIIYNWFIALLLHKMNIMSTSTLTHSRVGNQICFYMLCFSVNQNVFINPLHSLVMPLGPCELAGVLGLAFTKHTLARFHTHHPKDSKFRHRNGGFHGDWLTPLRRRSHIILNMTFWNWETPEQYLLTHLFTPTQACVLQRLMKTSFEPMYIP